MHKPVVKISASLILFEREEEFIFLEICQQLRSYITARLKEKFNHDKYNKKNSNNIGVALAEAMILWCSSDEFKQIWIL